MPDRFTDYITIKEASEQWGVTSRAVTYYVVSGRLPGSIKKGSMWLIPTSAEKPEDLRKFGKGRPRKKADAKPTEENI